MITKIIQVSEFLQSFSPISLHYTQPETCWSPSVFWSQTENNSSSVYYADDLGTHHKIVSAFSNTARCLWFFGQFWAPVTIGGRRVLSTSGQPFAVWPFSNEMAKRRQYSEKYKYNIDMNKLHIEGDLMIINGGPATAFLNCVASLQQIPSEICGDEHLNYSLMLPICFPSQSSCIGVLECGLEVFDMIRAFKKAGLDVIPVQDRIPYKNIDGLKRAKDEITEALKVVCEIYSLALAQVWITYEDKSEVLLSSSFGDTQTNRLLAIKLTGYLFATVEEDDDSDVFNAYFRLCDLIPLGTGWDGFPLETLQDYGSRYISVLPSDKLIRWDYTESCYLASAFSICLRSNDTGDFNYVFEFIWTKHDNYVIFLEAIIFTLKRCLPKYKFASGIELGDELDVIAAQSATQSKDDKIGETEKFKIFEGKRSTPMPEATQEGTKPKVGDYIAPSRVVCKTTPKVLPREVIEKQFGKTMKEAAENLNVSLSTFKRKIKELGILEWQGPNFKKRNTNDAFITQINTYEEDYGAIKDTSTVNININTVTLKVEHEDDMYKFNLPISQATFVNVEKDIGSVRTYKLKYLDEDKEWICLTSEEEMSYCINSSRKSDRIVVRLRVLPSS